MNADFLILEGAKVENDKKNDYLKVKSKKDVFERVEIMRKEILKTYKKCENLKADLRISGFETECFLFENGFLDFLFRLNQLQIMMLNKIETDDKKAD